MLKIIQRNSMKFRYKKSLIVLTLLSTTLHADKGDIYAGLEWYGLSGKYDVTNKVTAQAIVGVWGYADLTSITGRGIYKFKQKDYYNLYGYGSATSWSWDNGYNKETVVGFGAGGGIEYDIRGLDQSLPPIFLNADLGIQYANFSYYGGFGGVGLGLGVHYKF